MDEFLSEIYIEVFKQWILMQSNKFSYKSIG